MINVDITTRNTVYNTLSAQAQWVQHRFGKRKYPTLDIDADIIINSLKTVDKTISFVSVYGDPCLHPDFVKILKNMSIGKTVVNTYLNFDNEHVIDALNFSKSYVVVPLYGFGESCNEIILNSKWSLIDRNLKKLTCSVCIEFYTFEHNIHQLDQVKKYCNDLDLELSVKKGVALHPDGFSPIVNDNGVWLYDAYPCIEDSPIKWGHLYKTTNGYNSLIQFVKPMKGKPIHEYPNVYPVHLEHIYDKNMCISVTGDVFPSNELHQIFTNALCDDWNLSLDNIVGLDKITVRDEFKYICSSVHKIYQLLKQENNIYKKGLSEILTNFADSNV